MSTTTRNHVTVWAVCFFAFATSQLRADQLQMQNGDRYAGKILSVSSNSVVLESDILGKVTLPRARVTALTFGTNTAQTTTSAPVHIAGGPVISSGNTNLSAAFRGLGANTNFIQQVRGQMLAGATPEANQKYDELVDGLMTGKMSLNDLRNQARTSIDQINQLKHELGPEADESLDSYVAILQSFVNESAPGAAPVQPATGLPVAPQTK